MTKSPANEILSERGAQPLLRYLAGAPAGIDETVLSADERQVVEKLLELGAVSLRDGKVVVAGEQHEFWDAVRSATGANTSNATNDESAAALLRFVEELDRTIMHSSGLAELLRTSFRQLAMSVEYDIGAAVMIEQNLDLYLMGAPGRSLQVDERLIEQIRGTLQREIPVSFRSTDIIVRGDFTDLPGPPATEEAVRYEACTLLRQEERTAGLLTMHRAAQPFSSGEQTLLDIFSSQIALVLGNLRAQEQIQNLADTDDLTGIWNKRYFRRQLPNEVERSRIYNVPLSLIMLDVDDFKGINDSYGHVMGDVALSELCGCIRETLRPPDLFARFGGDEFALILPHTDVFGATRLADRIQKKVHALDLRPDGVVKLRCTVSMGIAGYVPPDMSAADLIQRADERLYVAKHQGKDRYSW